MMKKLLLLTLAILLLLLMVHSLLGAAQPQELSFSDLTLEISTPKEEFNQLEPIPLTISLSNKTDQAILGHATLRFNGNYIRLLVEQLGGEGRRIEDLSMIRAYAGASPQKILPGQTLQERQLIDLDLDKIFPYPGEYQLQAELIDVDGKKTIKSNHVKIRILEPADQDQQAFDFIKNNANPSYFLNGYEFHINKKALKVLEEFVARFSDTAYGDYALFQLSEYYLVNDEHGKAVKLLEKLEKKSNFIFATKVKDYLAKSKEKLEKSAKMN